MARKLLVVLCMTFFFTQEGKANAAVFALLGSWGHLLYARPYGAALHNRLAIVVLAATICVLYAGTFDDFALRRFGVIAGILVNVGAIVGGNVADIVRMAREEKAAEADQFFQPGVFRMDSGVEAATSHESTLADVELDDLAASP